MQNVCEMKRNEAKLQGQLLLNISRKGPFSSRYHQGWIGLSPLLKCLKIAALGTAGGRKK